MKQSSPGAQTERRGDAGPVSGLLGGKASPADFVVPVLWSVVYRKKSTD
jgi:hypothetical protein